MSSPNDGGKVELPVVDALGLVKVKGGWSVVAIKTQGDRVVGREVVRGPEPRAVALEAMKLEFVRRFISAGVA